MVRRWSTLLMTSRIQIFPPCLLDAGIASMLTLEPAIIAHRSHQDIQHSLTGHVETEMSQLEARNMTEYYRVSKYLEIRPHVNRNCWNLSNLSMRIGTSPCRGFLTRCLRNLTLHIYTRTPQQKCCRSRSSFIIEQGKVL